MKGEGLGEPREENKYKIYYFLWILAIFVYIGWAWIGVKTSAKLMVSYYAWLGLFAVAFILFDNLTKGTWGWLDTVTLEKTPINPKWILLGSIVLSVILGARILVTQSAFIPYPKFQIFDYAFPNALLSGAVGVIENLMFFSLLLPTFFVILNSRFFKNFLLSGIASILGISILFMVYHIFVYGANEPAMLSTFLFAMINGILVVTLRTTMVCDALHFTNNVVAFLIQAGVSYVFF